MINNGEEVMYEDEEYFDTEGNPTTLYKLIRSEPDWAANVIRQYKKENERMRGQLAIADGYLCSIALHHPHLVPNECVGENEYRLTIYDTEENDG